MAPEDSLVNGHGYVVLRVQIHVTKQVKDKDIGNETRRAENPTALPSEVDESEGSEYIADRNGLERIGERMELFPVKVQEIALDDPTQEEKQGEPLDKFKVEFFSWPEVLVLRHGEWDSRSRHEHEERHDYVPEYETFPRDMGELMPYAIPGRRRICIKKCVENRPCRKQQEKVQSTQYVKRGKPLVGFHLRMFTVRQLPEPLPRQ